MAPASPRETAEAYFEAWSQKDFAAARNLLHDDLSFQGPYDSFDNADDLIGAIQQLASITQRLVKRKVFADGQDVCIIYDLVPNKPVDNVPMAEWYEVTGDKISSIRIIFDTGAFAAISS